MFRRQFFRSIRLRNLCVAGFFISTVYIYFQIKAPGDIFKDQQSMEPIFPFKFSTNISVRGVAPQNLHYYHPNSKGNFVCISSGEEISYDKINDDYCDCLDDGSDEPSTSACGFNYFHCSAPVNRDLFILTSRVNDGICDCCDGSDEYLNVIPPMKLPVAVQKKLGKYLSPCVDICS